ncbi:hypothetical protein [Olleya sp. ITB9]|uniref:hypothetical protein n=1 Tax=Olleya sp. ITB9 TaxID=1715648 RepID=UPI0006CF8731|nr:hypothetical protein [Olleya sp. ITB9]
MFWDKITDGDVAEADQHYNGKEKPEEKRTFSVDSSSIYHFHPIAFVEHMKLIVGKEHIDLRGDNSKWQTQFDSRFGNKKKQNVACWRACQIVLSNYNVVVGNLKNNKALFQIAIEKNNQLVVNTDVAKKSVTYLDTQLE